jgi:signal peptidase I
MDAPGNDFPRSSWARSLWAALLSLLAPGLGHILARSWRTGALLLTIGWLLDLAGTVLTHLMAPTPPMVALLFVLGGFQILFRLGTAADAFRRLRQPKYRPKPTWQYSTWCAAVVFVAIAVGTDYGLSRASGVSSLYGWRSFSMPSGSNIPTLMVGDYFLANLHYDATRPDYGDMVLFRLSRDPATTWVKRVVGLPGDRIQIKVGRLYINGNPCPTELVGAYEMSEGGDRLTAQRYKETLPNGVTHDILKVTNGTGASLQSDFDPARVFDPNNTIEYLVPRDHIFLLGDHRDNSMDSRFIQQMGYVPMANVFGRAMTVYWSGDRGRIFSPIR